MATTNKPLSVKRFGVRYGRTIKQKLSEIENELRKKHKCPYCQRDAVKRLSKGIWHCRKCNAKFSGAAYSPVKRVILKEELKEVKEEENKQNGPL